MIRRAALVPFVLAVACHPQPAAQPAGPAIESTPSGKIRNADPAPAALADGSRQRASTPQRGSGPRPAAAKPIEYRVLPPLDAAPIEARFATAYSRAKRPRIAVFFNRTLSDEVREWVEPARTTTSTSEAKVVGNGGVVTDRSTTTSTSTPATRPVTEARDAVAERMAWQVETAFSQPLLSQGVKLIDRATIMRLVALKSGKQDDPKAQLAIKHVEMSALVGHADYFVELLVSSSGESPLGYDLKASVKAVQTGQIVANLTTATWPYASPPKQPPPTRKAVATDKGYEYVDVPPPPIKAVYPTTTEVATQMAQRVLSQLADAFERNP